MIRTPVVFEPNSTVIKYPTNRAQWKNTFVENGYLVGSYEGNLYRADGSTKSFPWEHYTPPTPNYGTVITSLAFFDRMTETEENFFRETARVNVDVEKLLARAERLTDEIDVTRMDVINGVNGILSAMAANSIGGYTDEYAVTRAIDILLPAKSLADVPERLRNLL